MNVKYSNPLELALEAAGFESIAEFLEQASAGISISDEDITAMSDEAFEILEAQIADILSEI